MSLIRMKSTKATPFGYYLNSWKAGSHHPKLSECTSSKRHKNRKNGRVTSYSEVIYYLLETYAMDDVMVEMNAETLRFIQPSIVTPTEHAKALGDKALSGELVYEYVLKWIYGTNLADIRTGVRGITPAFTTLRFIQHHLQTFSTDCSGQWACILPARRAVSWNLEHLKRRAKVDSSSPC